MQPPDELMTTKLLPSLRNLVSRRLRSEGFSQTRISSMLGVTQASVSLYLSGRPERAYSDLTDLSLDREESDRYVALLAEDLKRNPLDSVETLGSLWANLLGKGLACPAHRKLYPSLAQCDVCVRAFRQQRRETSEPIEQVARAVRVIEDSPSFVSVMPEVSVNIACVHGESTSLEDVVAIPGRIVRVKDSAKAMFPPEFGASRHMARMLLLARRRMPRYHASINLTYNREIARVLRRLGLRTIVIGGSYPHGSEDPTVEALASRLLQPTEKFDAVVDSGGKGIEPSLYLFGESATEVASLAVRIAELHSAG
jgi:predicted fused transcriptional regulator/phosphomethylpyrimidine kinase/predicted transcriptional regulator